MWLAVFYLRYQPRSPEAEFSHSLREQRQLRKYFLYDDRNSSYICKSIVQRFRQFILSGGGSHELLFLTIRDIPQLDQNTGHARFTKHQKPACLTPRSTRLQAPNDFCISEARLILCSICLFCINSKIIYDSEEVGSKPSYFCR